LLKVSIRYVGCGVVEDRLLEAVHIALNGIPLLRHSTDPGPRVEVSCSGGDLSRASKRAIVVESPN
jgi:hypothetical protein